jgi:hypothetical protein
MKSTKSRLRDGDGRPGKKVANSSMGVISDQADTG